VKKEDIRHKQHGFTLVEIMIAITIGLVMLAGILQINQANKESNRLQRNMGFVQENIRSAMELLARDIRMAGYYEDDNSANPISAPIAPFVVATTWDDSNELNTTGSDTITLNYESDQDCLGQTTPVVAAGPAAGNRFAINHYFIRDQRLMCRGNGNATAQPLVDGVESLQILYGENTNDDPLSANRYVRAEQIADMGNVVSVRIGMRFISQETVRSAIDANSYTLLDAAPFTPNDRLLRREITTTVSLRNNL